MTTSAADAIVPPLAPAATARDPPLRSRMTRHLLIPALGALLLPGCLLHRVPNSEPVQPAEQVVADGGPPHRARTAQSVKPPGTPTDARIIHIGYNDVPPRAPDVPAETLIEPTPPMPPAAPPAPDVQPAQPEPAPRPEDPLVAALKSYRGGRPDEAARHLARFDPAARELLARLLPFAARLADDDGRMSPQELALALRQFDGLLRSVRPRAALCVDGMCFCREITGFGVFEKLPDNPGFEGGTDGRPGEPMKVYVEVRNFAAEPGPHGHTTRLAATVEVHDYQKKVAWRKDIPAQANHSQSPRGDLFVNFWLPVPADLVPGDYTLWITVHDMTAHDLRELPAHRSDRRSLDFHVTAPGLGRARAERRPAAP